jgi:hypothetical protein
VFILKNLNSTIVGFEWTFPENEVTSSSSLPSNYSNSISNPDSTSASTATSTSTLDNYPISSSSVSSGVRVDLPRDEFIIISKSAIHFYQVNNSIL